MEIHVLGKASFSKSMFMLCLGQVLSVSHKVGVVTKEFMSLSNGAIEMTHQLFASAYATDLPENTDMTLHDISHNLDASKMNDSGSRNIFFTDSKALSMDTLMRQLIHLEQSIEQESLWIFAEIFHDSMINEKYMKYYFKQFLTNETEFHAYYFDDEDIMCMIEQQHDHKLQCYKMSKKYKEILFASAAWLTQQEPKVYQNELKLLKGRV